MRDLRQADWFWLENDVVDRDDLTIYEKMLYICLARHSNIKTGYAFPSIKLLQKELGLKDERTVTKYARMLEKKGLILVERKKGISNRYYLNNINKTSNVPTPDVPTFDVVKLPTTHISCSEPPTSRAETTHIRCGSNYTRTYNDIMNHDTYDFFEKLFKQFEINFTTTNQKSVTKLLTKQTILAVKDYLVETYTNIKNTPEIKNIPAVFSYKISKGERQLAPTPKIKTSEVEETNYQNNNKTTPKKISNNQSDSNSDSIFDAKEILKEKNEREELDNYFETLSDDMKKGIIARAVELVKTNCNVSENIAIKLAQTIWKYKVLRAVKNNNY